MSETPSGSSTSENPSSGDATGSGNDVDYGAIILRALFMLFYAFVGYVTMWVLGVMAIIHFIVVLVTGKPNPEFQGYGRAAARYLGEVMGFVVYAREEKPFPFGAPFPSGSED